MSLAPFRSLCLLTSLLLLLATATSARHIHRHAVHHHARDATPLITPDETPSPTIDVTATAIAAGNEAIEDIQQIGQGLADLPGNLLGYIQAVEARLEKVEARLGEVENTLPDSGGSSTSRLPPGPFATATASANASILSPIFPPVSVSAEALFSEATSSTTLGTVITDITYPTTFRTSRVTSTRVKTVTLQPSVSAAPYVFASGTSNYTQPYATTGHPAIITRTVLPLPDGVTITSTITTSSS